MQQHRSALWLTVFSLLLFCLAPLCRAGDSRAMAVFDGYWQREQKPWDDGDRRVICYQRFSSDPFVEGAVIAPDNAVLGEWRVFFHKGVHSLKTEGKTLDLREGETVVRRHVLLDRDRMRLSFPMNPEREPRDYRRIAEPVGGVRGGQESFFASFPGSWRQDGDGGVLNISFDRGELGLRGITSRKPLPEKLLLQSASVTNDEGQVFLFFIRHGHDPVVLSLDRRQEGGTNVLLVYEDRQIEEIGRFTPTGR